ncbi:hypothetical protein [Flavobacterium gelatinilyticum]|uniref:hypothetical protein n=1 Tax=Flavobacterium gelatinilyticum TaxID=3003260 RepID=UPI002480474C|nr:hypothetical protein [Flavobacterium gelatinilyticum]
MVRLFYYASFLLLFISCHGQENTQVEKIDVSKIKKITITNKIDCSIHKLKSGKIIIEDIHQIEQIINSFTYSTVIKTGVNTGAGYGFFEIDFDEEKKNHYYTINYTIYDGVILRNDNNGDLFKNDKLEGIVYSLFVSK